MGRETYFPQQYLCHNAKVVHAFEANTPFEKLPGTQINVPRLNLHKRPRHRRCPTSRDFVPWRFSDAGRRSVWIASSCRHPKTCTRPVIGHPHSITWSARASSVGGTSRPRDLAVARLMIISKVVGCTTGRSVGFSP